MKLTQNFLLTAFLCISIIYLAGCQENPVMPIKTPQHNLSGSLRSLGQVNLVSDTNVFSPRRIDPNLVNAWGIAMTTTGQIWISSNGVNKAVIYDVMGNMLMNPITIPGANSMPGDPSGAVFNSTSDFKINGIPATLLFASEDGTITGWNSGSSSVIVVDRSSANAVYKGITIDTINGNNFLFATDFHNSKIDVFDKNFVYQAGVHFNDKSILNHWGPFNIANINGLLFVTFAKQKPPDFHDDDAGKGRGVVDIFMTDGRLVRTLVSKGGPLNSPWGIAPEVNGNILVGNFGDGKINNFDPDGNFLGQITDTTNKPVTIDGLWGIMFISNKLYFTAGPNHENQGLFGYLNLN